MSYMLEDHQGGVSAIASSSGSADVDESFTAFGLRRNPTTWSGAPTTADLNTIAGISRQGYTFQTWLGQSMGLNHMNGRVEDAILGRFVSPDPNVQYPTDAQSYNRYSYVRNNPVTSVDSTGFLEDDPSLTGRDGGAGGDGGGLPDPTNGAGNPSPPPSNPPELPPVIPEIPPIIVCSGCNPPAPSTQPPPDLPPINIAPSQWLAPNLTPNFGEINAAIARGMQTAQSPQPCSGIAGAIQDFTGGQSNQSFVDDVANNYVNTTDTGVANVIDNIAGTNLANTSGVPNPGVGTATSAAFGGSVAATYGGVTPLQAIGQAISASGDAIRIPGSIGFRTVPSLIATSAATWAVNALLIKGAYSAGVLVGSVARTAANRAATALCGP